jgi:nitrate/TMAO reductase-like tetraheme cytochrome c subunit
MRILQTLWRAIRRPSARFAAGTLVVIGAVGALVLGVTFNSVVAYTNTTAFCVSCHENVAAEYQDTIHYRSRSGVQAGCADCHVPHQFGPKMVAKAQAVTHVWGQLVGTIDTPEKFEAKRLVLAERVWSAMEANDSMQCRTCHDWNAMDLENQALRARRQHEEAMTTGETCIDCHKGIAHKMPEQEGEDEDASFDFAF